MEELVIRKSSPRSNGSPIFGRRVGPKVLIGTRLRWNIWPQWREGGTMVIRD